MKLKLKQRRIVKTVDVREFDVVEGMNIYYYGTDLSWIESPAHGGVKQKEDKTFEIVWDDVDVLPTPLDGSEKSLIILESCGW